VKTTRYVQQPYPWIDGYQPIDPGISGGPRLSATGEMEANMPRVWPTQYRWTLMGLGAMPRFQLGYTAPTFDNQLSPAPYGYNWFMPGIARTPFGS
jgi:hypothetical protein